MSMMTHNPSITATFFFFSFPLVAFKSPTCYSKNNKCGECRYICMKNTFIIQQTAVRHQPQSPVSVQQYKRNDTSVFYDLLRREVAGFISNRQHAHAETNRLTSVSQSQVAVWTLLTLSCWLIIALLAVLKITRRVHIFARQQMLKQPCNADSTARCNKQRLVFCFLASIMK